jgi:hypothetical protein
MMGSNQKKSKPKRASRFILCPAGCGKHVADIEINNHLDSCIERQHEVEQKKPDPGAADEQQPVSPKAVLSETSNELATGYKTPDTKQAPVSKPDTPGTEKHEGSNVFAHMMKRSKLVFSTAEPIKLGQRFHLNADGTVSLTCYSTNPGLSQPQDIKWSATVQVKGKRLPSDEAEDKPMGVELIVSSSIDSAPRKTRLVKRHSRLSVPVLKSILQKSIRRRKPLPSVRVAMELVDKSLGDLLRRLPIIILEDSSLHPSFSFLTWLMVAHSKDFELPPNLMSKVLGTVYEMASCPWQDLGYHGSDDSNGTTSAISFQSYHQPGIDTVLEDHDITIWSMLLRAQYGGMAGDIRMLHSYATVWNERFSEGNVPEWIAQRLSASSSQKEALLRWSDLPTLFHQSSIRQSPSRVGPLCQQTAMASLTMTDITTEGVDFHCSSILETILSDRELVEQCYKRLEGIAGLEDDSSTRVPAEEMNGRRRAWLEGIVKRCMWNYSAGVNRRLSLTRIVDPKKPETGELKAFWDKLIQRKAKGFAERYVKERLSY